MYVHSRSRFLVGLLSISLLTLPSVAAAREVVELTEEHFRYGTYIIDRPGRYRLTENISFNPNSPATLTAAIASGALPPDVVRSLGLATKGPVDAYHAGFPLYTQFVPGASQPFSPGGPLEPRYDPKAFGLGFFAAIVIAAQGVELDLSGHTIEQSAEHALLQRFFAVIELAEQPFLPAQGPADFGNAIVAANNVVIRNGTIGRSSHHGIHGNDNRNVIIANVDFVDYEVAAVSLNGVRGLWVNNVNASNRKDVPVLGTFSSAQFIKPYLAWLSRAGSTTELLVGGTALGVAEVEGALRTAVNNVHRDVIVTEHLVDGRAQINATAHPNEYALFANPFGVVDGNAYSFAINRRGVAVNGFPARPTSDAARSVVFSNVHVKSQHAFINEVVALNQNGKAVVDPVGAVFQLLNRHPYTDAPITVSSLDPGTARYVGNAVANAQALVAKAALAGEFSGSNLDLSRLTISQQVVDWIEGHTGFEALSSVASSPAGFFCNGDSMFHVNKGVIAFKMDAAKGVLLRNTSVTDLVNLGRAGSDICGDYGNSLSHPDATLPGYGGAATRAYTFAGSERVYLLSARANGLTAAQGSATGVDVLTDSQRVFVRNVSVDEVRAGLDGPPSYHGPNADPQAVGFRVGRGATHVAMHRICADLLSGLAGEQIFEDLSGLGDIRWLCR